MVRTEAELAEKYAKLDSRTAIEIISPALADPTMLAEVLKRVGLRYHDCASKVTITCNEPERDGSTTYMLHIEYTNGGGIFIGALRRAAGAEVEYHS